VDLDALEVVHYSWGSLLVEDNFIYMNKSMIVLFFVALFSSASFAYDSWEERLSLEKSIRQKVLNFVLNDDTVEPNLEVVFSLALEAINKRHPLDRRKGPIALDGINAHAILGMQQVDVALDAIIKSHSSEQ